MTANELKCYGCNKEVYQINSCQFNHWVDEYKKDLESYIKSDAAPRVYSDLDSSYRKDWDDHSFFYDLVTFLNEREKEMKNSLQGGFAYRFSEGKGIGVFDKDNDKEEPLFWLRSDQFGFSAPIKGGCYPNYPYDLYLDLYIKEHGNKDEAKDKAIEQVIEWISRSRTIGGSFLWPIQFWENYNKARGGKVIHTARDEKTKRKNDHYIQDRVDLTLWEIKNWYSGNGMNDILERCKESNLEQWLGHFKNFKTYVEFFKYESFVKFVSSDKSYNPINIITGKSDAPVRGKNGKNPEPAITESMEFTSLEKMLKTLNNKIVERSIEMTKIIDKENQSGS